MPKRLCIIRVAGAVAILVGALLATMPFTTVASAQTGWSNPAPVDETTPEAFEQLSCPTTTFCAGTNIENEASIYNGTVWSAETTYESLLPSTFDLSCASSTFCVAIDDQGNAIIYNGSTWKVTPGPGLGSVSCVSSTFCMSVTSAGGGQAVLYNGSTWTATTIDPAVSLVSVSCPTTTFCVAFDQNGNAFTYNGSSWSGPVSVDPNGSNQVSCTVTPSTLCVEVDMVGDAFVDKGSGWTEQDADGSNDIASLSCASATSCVAVDSEGNSLTFNGSSWSSPQNVTSSSFYAVSCAAGSSSCLAIDGDGNYFRTSNGGSTWSSPLVEPDSALIAITAVSCPTSSFCVAGDVAGNVITYDGKSWSDPKNVEEYDINSVSCPTATFCAAVGSDGQVVTYDGSTWSAAADIAPGTMVGVSCASASLCVAVDTAGDALLYNGSDWSDNAAVDGSELVGVSCAPGTTFCAAIDTSGNVITNSAGGSGSWTTSLAEAGDLSSVSCATASVCVVVDGDGDAVTTDNGGGTWSSPDDIDSGQSLTSVSCAISSFCTAVDAAGNALLTDNGGGTWSSPTDIDGTTPLESVSCASPTFCAAVDDSGDALLYTPPAPAGLYVSAVSPYTGLTSGDTAVTISGSGFTTYDVTDVYFGTQAASHVVVENNTTITADSPAESAGTVDVTVATTSGTSAVNAADQFTYTVATSPTSKSCTPSCSEALSTPLAATTVLASGTSSESGATLDLSVNAGTLPCPGPFDYTAAVSDLSTSDFVATATVTVTETIGDLPSTKAVKVCYAPLSASTGTFLSKCHHHVVAPCLKSLTELYGHAGVVATLVARATDPRFWTGAQPLKVTGFTPTHGAPGSTVTIKGSNLTGTVGVSIGGATAHITKATAKELKVTVPAQALTGLVTVTAASGSVTSPNAFTVTS